MNMEKLEVIQKICEVILKFNNTETRKETTKNKPTFFFNFAGHVLLFEVCIHKNGYDYFDKNDKCSDYIFFLDDEIDKLYDIYIEVLETISNYYKNI